MSASKPIPLKSIDAFWKKLDFSPAVPQNAEFDYGAEIDNLKKELLLIPDENQKRSVFKKIMSSLPGRSKKKEPEKREDPRGRPKMDPARQSSYTPQASQDPPHHSSYSPQASQDPPRNSSYFPSSSRLGGSKGKQPKPSVTGADLGFPLLDDPMWVPVIEKF